MEDTKKEMTMDDAKNEFMKHLKQARAQGIAIGSKTVAAAIMGYLDRIDVNSVDTYKECFENIKTLCEKTTKLTLSEFSDEMKTIQEIMDVANDESRNVDVFEELSEEDKTKVEEDLQKAQVLKQQKSDEESVKTEENV